VKIIGLALILTIAACGKGNDGKLSSSQAASPAPLGAAKPVGAVQPSDDPATRIIDLRLHGVASPGSVLVSPSAVEVSVDGVSVATQLVEGQIDLGDESQAWRVATFIIPAAARSVAIHLTLAPEGTVEKNGKTETLDLRGAPISFQAEPAKLRTENKVAVDIDLSRSIVPQNGGAVLLPDLLVRY
jgi:hypothetical protein